MQIYDMPGNQAPYSSELNPLSFFFIWIQEISNAQNLSRDSKESITNFTRSLNGFSYAKE